MSDLVWSEEIYGTGDPTLDEQHRELFKRVNLLTKALAEEDEDDEIKYFMEFLEGHVVKHFRCEEGVMERRKCSGCKLNKKEHGEFLNLLSDFKTRFELEGPTRQFGETVSTTVQNWIRAHLGAVDTLLRETPPPPPSGS